MEFRRLRTWDKVTTTYGGPDGNVVLDLEDMNITGSIKPLSILQVMREMTRFNPDVVHAHMGGVTFAIPWCNLHKKPLVLTIHTSPEKAFMLTSPISNASIASFRA